MWHSKFTRIDPFLSEQCVQKSQHDVFCRLHTTARFAKFIGKLHLCANFIQTYNIKCDKIQFGTQCSWSWWQRWSLTRWRIRTRMSQQCWFLSSPASYFRLVAWLEIIIMTVVQLRYVVHQFVFGRDYLIWILVFPTSTYDAVWDLVVKPFPKR